MAFMRSRFRQGPGTAAQDHERTRRALQALEAGHRELEQKLHETTRHLPDILAVLATPSTTTIHTRETVHRTRPFDALLWGAAGGGIVEALLAILRHLA